MTLFLDSAAAAPGREAFLVHFLEAARNFGSVNPEAAHTMAHKLRQALQSAEMRLSRSLTGTDRFMVHWSASGTDALNAAAFALKKILLPETSVLTTRAEHPALSAALSRELGKERLIMLPLTADGGVDLARISEVCANRKIGACLIHHVNSQTGRVQDLSALKNMLTQVNPNIRLWVDAVQSAGKLPLCGIPAETLIVSGHKWGTPPGAAVLTRSADAVKVFSLLRHEYRCGRPDVPTALTLAFAAEQLQQELPEKIQSLNSCRARLRAGIAQLAPEALFPVPEEMSSPYILSVIFPRHQGAVLVRMLGSFEVMAGAGSACQAESKEPPPALVAMGIPAKNAFGLLRLSFDSGLSDVECDKFLSALEKVLLSY